MRSFLRCTKFTKNGYKVGYNRREEIGLNEIIEEKAATDGPLVDVMDRLIGRYGRSGSGRASVLRLIGAYVIFQTEGGAGFRKRGYSRDSIQLYRDKLQAAGVTVK